MTRRDRTDGGALIGVCDDDLDNPLGPAELALKLCVGVVASLLVCLLQAHTQHR
jgi:hypothetical protein